VKRNVEEPCEARARKEKSLNRGEAGTSLVTWGGPEKKHPEGGTSSDRDYYHLPGKPDGAEKKKKKGGNRPQRRGEDIFEPIRRISLKGNGVIDGTQPKDVKPNLPHRRGGTEKGGQKILRGVRKHLRCPKSTNFLDQKNLKGRA